MVRPIKRRDIEQRQQERAAFIEEHGLPDNTRSALIFELTKRDIPLEGLVNNPARPLYGQGTRISENQYRRMVERICADYGVSPPDSSSMDEVSTLNSLVAYVAENTLPNPYSEKESEAGLIRRAATAMRSLTF